MNHDAIDTKALIEHLRTKWQDRPCVMCGQSNWSVQDRAFELREFHGPGLVLGGQIAPVIPVVCRNCGNTVLVNAIVAGAVKPEADKVEAKS